MFLSTTRVYTENLQLHWKFGEKKNNNQRINKKDEFKKKTTKKKEKLSLHLNFHLYPFQNFGEQDNTEVLFPTEKKKYIEMF